MAEHTFRFRGYGSKEIWTFENLCLTTGPPREPTDTTLPSIKMILRNFS